MNCEKTNFSFVIDFWSIRLIRANTTRNFRYNFAFFWIRLIFFNLAIQSTFESNDKKFSWTKTNVSSTISWNVINDSLCIANLFSSLKFFFCIFSISNKKSFLDSLLLRFVDDFATFIERVIIVNIRNILNYSRISYEIVNVRILIFWLNVWNLEKLKVYIESIFNRAKIFTRERNRYMIRVLQKSYVLSSISLDRKLDIFEREFRREHSIYTINRESNYNYWFIYKQTYLTWLDLFKNLTRKRVNKKKCNYKKHFQL